MGFNSGFKGLMCSGGSYKSIECSRNRI